MRVATLLLATTLSCGYGYAANPVNAMLAYADDATLDTPFTLQSETQVPGKVLKPGSYTMTIKDHLSDRAILQVVSDKGKVESTFLGIFHSGLQSAGSAGPISMTTLKGHQALRGFSFPGGGTIEFAYPKAEAAAIATKSSDKVLAIDPESDNLHVKGASLSKEDAQAVTLWSLQATRVSANGPSAISASKFVSPGTDSNATPAVARVSPPAPSQQVQPAPPAAQAAVATAPAPRSRRAAPPVSAQVASNTRRPALAALPHTASNMPLLLLAALTSFVAAAGVRFRRWTLNAI